MFAIPRYPVKRAVDSLMKRDTRIPGPRRIPQGASAGRSTGLVTLLLMIGLMSGLVRVVGFGLKLSALSQHYHVGMAV